MTDTLGNREYWDTWIAKDKPRLQEAFEVMKTASVNPSYKPEYVWGR